MTFREALPPSCPPAVTQSPSEQKLWRLLMAPAPTVSDFDSQWKKQPHRKFRDECSARAISLVTTLEACRAAAKSPRMPPFTYAALVTYDPSAGIWHQDKPTHVNWWPYSSIDPLNAVGQVEALDG